MPHELAARATEAAAALESFGAVTPDARGHRRRPTAAQLLTSAIRLGLAEIEAEIEALPEVTATLSPSGHTCVVTCPGCGKRHTHGASPGPRASHCGMGSYEIRIEDP